MMVWPKSDGDANINGRKNRRPTKFPNKNPIKSKNYKKLFSYLFTGTLCSRLVNMRKKYWKKR